jgi:two-component system response regulator
MEKGQKVILLVEDNPDDEKLTVMGFKRNNIANPIVVAHDGKEALDYLFCQGAYAERDPLELPQVVVLDLKLPKIHGIEVLKKIRENPETHYLPVVVLTSSKEDRDIVETYELGVNAYVQKPVDFNEFGEAVKHLGMFWLLLNSAPNPRSIRAAMQPTLSTKD